MVDSKQIGAGENNGRACGETPGSTAKKDGRRAHQKPRARARGSQEGLPLGAAQLLEQRGPLLGLSWNQAEYTRLPGCPDMWPFFLVHKKKN